MCVPLSPVIQELTFGVGHGHFDMMAHEAYHRRYDSPIPMREGLWSAAARPLCPIRAF